MRQKYFKTEMVDGQVMYNINHPKFEAKITQHGGQLLSFKDTQSQSDWLWLSKSASLKGDRAIRGGVPLCWPWFGPSPNPKLPQHGYARVLPWNLLSCEGNESELTIRLNCNLEDAEIDLKHLSLVVEYILGDDIKINLHTENLTDKTISISQAIHTYFNVSDIHKTKVKGLEGVTYINQLTGKELLNENELVIAEEVDCIYKTNQSKVVIKTPNCQYLISGNHYDSVVVWNPWQDKAKSMADFDDEGFKEMLCVEMANTNALTIPAKQDFTLSQHIQRI